MEEKYSVINIYESFKRKYQDYLKPEIISISIIQSIEEIWLESITCENVDGGYIKETISKINLDFITDGEDEQSLFFNPKEAIENNVRKFIEELTPYSIIMTTDLFHESACDKINKKYTIFGVDK
jgi:hypothetical protein